MAAPTPQIDVKAQAWEGARFILQETLSLQTGDGVALFHDEQGVALANLFGDVARALRLRYNPRFVPRENQLALSGRTGQPVPVDDSTAIDHADGVLLCLSEELRTTPYRRQLLDRAAGDQRVTGVLPPTLSALVDAHRRRQTLLPDQCGDLAQILLKGKEAEVTTAVLDARGDVIEEHSLMLALGGFQRCPATAGDPIPTGTWAPLATTNAVIAPLEDCAHGVFVLNGAFPGGAMSGPEHLLLVFAAGRLDMVGGNSPRVGEFWKIVESGKALGMQPLSLASFGIRLGSEVPGHHLVQLGLGDNTALGGQLHSPIQETLLSRGGSLTVDGQPVLRDGRPVYDRGVWQETLASARRLAPSLTGELVIERTPNNAHIDAQGQFRVIRRVGRQRTCNYRLGDDDLSARLSDLYQLIVEQTEPISLFSLSRLCLPGIAAHLADLRGLLAMLQRHDLITARPPSAT